MRRIISVLLAIAMLFSCGMVAMAEEATAPAVGIQEMDFLAKLGIMNADADPEATITRAEMAKIVMMCIGQGANLAPASTPFTDVDAENEYSGYIQLANSAGIMVGGGDGTFNPSGNVTYNQMVKLLTHAIGYEAFAQAAGGYPGGYLMAASNNEMLVGTTPSGEQAVSHGVAAILIKNALDIDIYERVSYGDSYEYVSKAGVTALTKYFDVYEFQGVVTANYYGSLSGASNIKKDEIVFDGATVLKTGTSGAEDYLGFLVNLYVKVDNEARYNTVVAAYPLYNEVTVVNGDDVMNETSETLLVYLGEDTEEELKIDTNADMIYNGSSKFWSADDLKGNYGDITAVDNDCDGDADVLIVYNYENIIVDGIRVADNIVYTEDRREFEIDAENEDIKTTFIDTAGEDFTVDRLEEGDVISIALSADGRVMKAIINYDVVEGAITAFDNDTITIGEDVYKYDARTVTAPSAADFNREAVFYLDFTGKVAAINFNAAINGMEYGYLRAAAVSGTGFNRKAEVEMLVEEGIEIFELAKEVKLNGTTVSNDVAIADAAIQDGGTAKKQLIMYSRDAEGKIDKINTAVDDTANTLSQKEKDDTFTHDFSFTGVDAAAVGSVSQRMFARSFIVNGGTKIFVVQNPSEDRDREELYKVMTPADIAFSWGEANLYDVDSERVAGAAVLYYTDGMFSAYKRYTTGVVTGISKALDEDGDPVNRYTLYTETGVTKTVDIPSDIKTVTHTTATNVINTAATANLFNDLGTLKGDITLADIKIGDVMQYSVNAISGEVERVRLAARLDALDMRQNDIGTNNGYVTDEAASERTYAAYGTIDDIIKAGIIIDTIDVRSTGTTDAERILGIEKAKYLSYDKATSKLKEISKNDLVNGDDIYVWKAVNGETLIISID